MKEVIRLKPVEMTSDVMQDLENRGLIIRLCPNHHLHDVPKGENLGQSIYESDIAHGSHKLISVTINKPYFGNFGTHPDNEEFLLIGDPNSKPLYLNIFPGNADELNKKITDQNLTAEDFICLRVKYNDPNVSFFTMISGVPHGESAGDTEGQPASFYVTEPRDLTIDKTDFGDYKILPPI